MAIKVKGQTVIYDDEVVRVSSNTEVNRPGQPEIGMLRFNTDSDNFEGYFGEELGWGPLGGGTSSEGINYFAQNIGDNVNTEISVNHGLADANVIVSVYENSSKAKVYPDIIYTNTNTITFKFAEAPTTAQYRVIIFSTAVISSFKSYAANFGDGSTNPITITHNLFSTNLLFAIRNNSTGYYVYPDATIIDANRVELEFVNTPTTNQYVFIALGY